MANCIAENAMQRDQSVPSVAAAEEVSVGVAVATNSGTIVTKLHIKTKGVPHSAGRLLFLHGCILTARDTI